MTNRSFSISSLTRNKRVNKTLVQLSVQNSIVINAVHQSERREMQVATYFSI